MRAPQAPRLSAQLSGARGRWPGVNGGRRIAGAGSRAGGPRPLLFRFRWPLVGAVAAVALGKMVELGVLNRRLRHTSVQLALLSQVNHEFAASATLDEILDNAVAFGRRLVPARGVALVLADASAAIDARMACAGPEDFARWRRTLSVVPLPSDARRARHVGAESAGNGRCLVLPLHDGVARVGWMEFYLEPGRDVPADDLALLETIGGEIAEAITGSRRRSREERQVYDLERAIGEERARIAHDIHDGLAQTLAFERMRIDLWLDWIEADPERLRGELLAFKDALREQIGELRRAVFALRPVEFEDLGFLGGLQRYAVEFAEQQGWAIEVDAAGLRAALSAELEVMVFRVIQEALTNTAKHANAPRVWIRIAEANEGLEIVVRDDGEGFDPGLPRAVGHAGLGLRQMRERLAAFRGRLCIAAGPGAGTELRAWLPLPRFQPGESARTEGDGDGPAVARR